MPNKVISLAFADAYLRRGFGYCNEFNLFWHTIVLPYQLYRPSAALKIGAVEVVRGGRRTVFSEGLDQV